MSKEVKRFFIMPGAVPVMQSDSPAYTPMTNHETYLHTAPVVLGSDYDALLAERDAEWISAEILPAYPDAEVSYEANAYLVTDGYTVGICDFERGHGCGQPWAAWGNYGSLKPSEITHWKPLPAPPARKGAQP